MRSIVCSKLCSIYSHAGGRSRFSMSIDLAFYLERFLVFAVPVIGIVGLSVAGWSAVRTRRRYYDEFMDRRRSRRD